MKEIIKDISQQMIERYSSRYRDLGYNVKTLGWGNNKQQQFRFLQTLLIDFNGRSVLDVGCGFADYYQFLLDHKIDISEYFGWDLNKDLIEEAKKKYRNDPKVGLEVKNVFEEENNIQPVADIGVMLGVLNLNLKDTINNYKYSQTAIEKAFNAVNEVLIVDFLSAIRTPDYLKENFVFYHDPCKMLDYAFSLSSNVVLKHDYNPIPQKEFMLFIYK